MRLATECFVEAVAVGLKGTGEDLTVHGLPQELVVLQVRRAERERLALVTAKAPEPFHSALHGQRLPATAGVQRRCQQSVLGQLIQHLVRGIRSARPERGSRVPAACTFIAGSPGGRNAAQEQ